MRSHAMPEPAIHPLGAINFTATECLPRDAEPSRRLHEPALMITTIDPITGRDLTDLDGRPHHVDGNVVIYFENEENRRAYLEMPVDHPFRLVDNPTGEGEAEG